MGVIDSAADIILVVNTLTTQSELPSKVEPLLLEVADVVNTTLDLDTTLRRVAELVRKVIDYEIFAILLLNERAQELRFRFQVGYPKEVADRIKVRVGEGVTGRDGPGRCRRDREGGGDDRRPDHSTSEHRHSPMWCR